MQLYFTGGNNDQANFFAASHSILKEQTFVFCIRAFTGDALAPLLFTAALAPLLFTPHSAAADAAANEKHAQLAPLRARICRRHTCVRTRREKEKKRSTSAFDGKHKQEHHWDKGNGGKRAGQGRSRAAVQPALHALGDADVLILHAYETRHQRDWTKYPPQDTCACKMNR
jgi:hypothetical protein